MEEYHKIQSLFMRNPADKHKSFLLNQWAMSEFEYLQDNEWVWTEKIDGTNVRVMYDGADVRFGGRTNDAQMPVSLLGYLQNTFTVDRMRECFPDISPDTAPEYRPMVYLFGEGYGAKIQKAGGRYLPTSCSFILFDVMINNIYLERHNVHDIAFNLGITVVPVVGTGTLPTAIDFVRQGFKSRIAQDIDFDAEGVVLRPRVELTTRRGQRIISKLKTRDFQGA